MNKACKGLWVFSFLILGHLCGANEAPFNKVFVVVLENTSISKALKQPFLIELSQRGAMLTHFSAIRHPSYPNYLALVSGSTQGKTSDHLSVFSSKHIGDLLEAKGKSWKNYAEGYRGDCQLKNYNRFVARHVPFLSFANMRVDDRCSQHIVDAQELETDIKNETMPDYSFYSPDLDNDGHDTGVSYAVHWLESAFRGKLDDPRFMKGLLFIVTFDEDEGLSLDNRVLTLLLGEGVIPGQISRAKYNHYSLLKTIEAGLKIGTLGLKDQSARPITGIWK